MQMIVTIDGPAGAGKSTVARALAQRLGFQYLDTGAMYRAVTLAALRAGLVGEKTAEIAALAATLDIQFDGPRVLLNGEDVSAEIRAPEVTSLIYIAADNADVRARLVELQRQAATSGNWVCEGRDQGTIAFPDARCKIFLTASPQERARRRYDELSLRGSHVQLDDILSQQTERDARDATRPVGALRQASDATLVLTDGLTLEEVVLKLEALVRARM
jgi:cytidylate kinase